MVLIYFVNPYNFCLTCYKINQFKVKLLNENITKFKLCRALLLKCKSVYSLKSEIFYNFKYNFFIVNFT